MRVPLWLLATIDNCSREPLLTSPLRSTSHSWQTEALGIQNRCRWRRRNWVGNNAFGSKARPGFGEPTKAGLNSRTFTLPPVRHAAFTPSNCIRSSGMDQFTSSLGGMTSMVSFELLSAMREDFANLSGIWLTL